VSHASLQDHAVNHHIAEREPTLVEDQSKLGFRVHNFNRRWLGS
jgi:hypothetical protein